MNILLEVLCIYMIYHEVSINSTHVWGMTGVGHCKVTLRYPGLFYQTPTYAINRWPEGSSRTIKNMYHVGSITILKLIMLEIDGKI